MRFMLATSRRITSMALSTSLPGSVTRRRRLPWRTNRSMPSSSSSSRMALEMPGWDVNSAFAVSVRFRLRRTASCTKRNWCRFMCRSRLADRAGVEVRPARSSAASASAAMTCGVSPSAPCSVHAMPRVRLAQRARAAPARRAAHGRRRPGTRARRRCASSRGAASSAPASASGGASAPGTRAARRPRARVRARAAPRRPRRGSAQDASRAPWASRMHAVAVGHRYLTSQANADIDISR